MFSSFYYSFTDWSGLGNANFIWFRNYIKLFTDPDVYPYFYDALWHSFYIFIMSIIIQTPVALYFAYTIDKKVLGHNLYRNIIFLPQVVSTVIVGFIGLLVFEPNIGLINNFLSAIGLESLAQPWLGIEGLALNIIIIVGIWKTIGVNTMLYLANIQSIPIDCMEASVIDGATEFKKFIYIVFPLLAPSFTINVVLTFIGSISSFDIVYAIAGVKGAPNYSSDVLGTFYYRFAFEQNFGTVKPDMGLATTIAVVMFIIILFISLIQIKVLRKREIEY